MSSDNGLLNSSGSRSDDRNRCKGSTSGHYFSTIWESYYPKIFSYIWRLVRVRWDMAEFSDESTFLFSKMISVIVCNYFPTRTSVFRKFWKSGLNHVSGSSCFHHCLMVPLLKICLIHCNHPFHSLSSSTFLFRIGNCQSRSGLAKSNFYKYRSKYCSCDITAVIGCK